jgi:rare lipoprotein A (peptidoglycan hydrolase)
LDSQTARRRARTAPRARRAPYRSAEPRPDRVAAWAIVLGLLMILLAGATSRADTGGVAAPADGGAAVPTSKTADGQSSSALVAKVAATPPETATWYGPGFFGRRTACGQVLRRSTQGVAHRRLPCGTQVTIYFRGRLKTVPVIDRGPYAHRATWDLTQATARELGVRRTSYVHVLH